MYQLAYHIKLLQMLERETRTGVSYIENDNEQNIMPSPNGEMIGSNSQCNLHPPHLPPRYSQMDNWRTRHCKCQALDTPKTRFLLVLLAEYRSLGGMRRGTPLIYRKKMVVTRNFEFILIQLFTLSTIQVYIGSYLIQLKSSKHQWALRYEQELRKTRGYGPTRDPCSGMCHHASWAPHYTLGLALESHHLYVQSI